MMGGVLLRAGARHQGNADDFGGRGIEGGERESRREHRQQKPTLPRTVERSRLAERQHDQSREQQEGGSVEHASLDDVHDLPRHHDPVLTCKGGEERERLVEGEQQREFS
jgi:hypothetical protein